MQQKLLLTCEHACLFIPGEFVHLFKRKNTLLKSAQGWDIGAYQTFKALHGRFQADAYYGKWSRLLVDLNRSEHHRNLFSEITKTLPETKKEYIVRKYYRPYRLKVYEQIEKNKQEGFQTIHIAVHSFPPNIKRDAKKTDLGLLYDPKRTQERKFALKFKSYWLDENQDYNLRLNYPFLGTSDSLTSALREQFAQKYYLGFEIELNQKHFKRLQEPNGIVSTVLHVLGKSFVY